MGVDKATRDVLRDIAAYPALVKGDPDIAKIRAAYDEVFAAWTSPAVQPTEESWVTRGRVTALNISPLSAEDADGAIIFIHGGGWSLGSAHGYAQLGRHLASVSGMHVLLPDFPQSPEHPFPAALDALREWILQVTEELSCPLFIAGDSAGGTLAAVLSQEPELAGKLTGQGLLYPVMDLRVEVNYRSRRKFGGGKYFLTNDGILGAAAMYCLGGAEPSDPRISPILRADVGKAPPTYFLLPEFDPLISEGELYARQLKAAGVEVDIFHAKKTIHGCASFSGRIAQGREGMERMAALFQSWAHI